MQTDHGLGPEAIDEALLVGGSSLLPEVDARLRHALPKARVGEWNPFAAVALGACEFARGGQVADRIYHDYALRLAENIGLSKDFGPNVAAYWQRLQARDGYQRAVAAETLAGDQQKVARRS